MKAKEIIFGIYDKSNKDAKATIVNGKCKSVKLLMKAPRSYYYSLYNDMMTAFEEQYPIYYKTMS